MLKERAAKNEETFCCHMARKGWCRTGDDCPRGHLGNEEIEAKMAEGCVIWCQDNWFDGACYHQRLREHP